MIKPNQEGVDRPIRLPSRQWLCGGIAGALWVSSNVSAQTANQLEIDDLNPHNVKIRPVEFGGKDALEVSVSAESRAQLEDLSTYECIYLRPTNGRAEDQERRNLKISQ